MHGENLFSFFVFSTGLFIFYFTILHSLISRIYFIDDYLACIDHFNTVTVQLFNMEIQGAILCKTVSVSSGMAYCTTLNRISSVQNSVSHVCDSICNANCLYCCGQTRSCPVNCRTWFLNYCICCVMNGIYHAWNSFCFLLNRIYQVCYGSWYVNYRSYTVKNPYIEFDYDHFGGSGTLLFEYLCSKLKVLTYYLLSVVRKIKIIKKFTKNILIFHLLNLQNTIHRLKTEINDRHLLV